MRFAVSAFTSVVAAAMWVNIHVTADTIPVEVLDDNLQVTTVLNAGLTQPIGIVFLAANDFLVLEKASGQVRRVTNGVIQATPVLDLAVNSASERGLLSLVLHPNFPSTPWVYVRWTQSSTGADTTHHAERAAPRQPRRPLHLERHDADVRSKHHPAAGTADRQHPCPWARGYAKPRQSGGEPQRRRDALRPGWEALHLHGRPRPPRVDAEPRQWTVRVRARSSTTRFGGPAPDNAHLSGVILRLNDDGSAPTDNPFLAAGTGIGGEAGANIQKVFSYGHRNAFGMAFDPYSGFLWETENGDDTFSELNRVVPGMNGGWIQIMGPLSTASSISRTSRSTMFGGALQQARFPPTRLANAPGVGTDSAVHAARRHLRRSRAQLEVRVGAGGNGVRARIRAGGGQRRHAVDRILAQLRAGRRDRWKPVPSPPDAEPAEGRRHAILRSPTGSPTTWRSSRAPRASR